LQKNAWPSSFTDLLFDYQYYRMIVELRDEQHQWRETSSSSGWSSGGGASSRKQRTARRLRPPAHRQPLLHNHTPLNAALQGLPRAATTGNAAQQIRAEREAPGHRPMPTAPPLPRGHNNCNSSWIWANGARQAAGSRSCLPPLLTAASDRLPPCSPARGELSAPSPPPPARLAARGRSVGGRRH
jgi:hypothetical protein